MDRRAGRTARRSRCRCKFPSGCTRNHEGSLAVPATFRFADRFSEGLAAVQTAEEKAWSYIDKTGQIVISPITCDLAAPFTDGLVMIQGPYGEGVGYISRRGEFVWPLRR
jgi:WG containing repeat